MSLKANKDKKNIFLRVLFSRLGKRCFYFLDNSNTSKYRLSQVQPDSTCSNLVFLKVVVNYPLFSKGSPQANFQQKKMLLMDK